jgi:uncharacterized protein (TIGR03437 family)
VQLEKDGVLSDAYPIPMTGTAPSLFSIIKPFSNPIPVVANPDGSINSTSNPAPAGSVVILYATGLGRTSPKGATATSLRRSYPARLCR